MRATYIRHPISVFVALSIFSIFAVAMLIPIEYIPIDTRYDKIQHACVFLTLTCSVAACLRINHWLIGLCLVVLAAGSEGIQTLLSYRSGSWEDFYADIIGISVACLCIEIIMRVYQACRRMS